MDIIIPMIRRDYTAQIRRWDTWLFPVFRNWFVIATNYIRCNQNSRVIGSHIYNNHIVACMELFFVKSYYETSDTLHSIAYWKILFGCIFVKIPIESRIIEYSHSFCLSCVLWPWHEVWWIPRSVQNQYSRHKLVTVGGPMKETIVLLYL